jgi:hypothetical protein
MPGRSCHPKPKGQLAGRAGLAQEAAALCDEILSLREKHPDVVGEQQNMTGPSGITGRMGSAFDEKWETFANEVDDLASRLAVKVKALDPVYPVGQFYEAKPQPWIARVPGGRVKMPDHERESLCEHVAHLHRDKPQKEIQELQTLIIANIENADTQRARSFFTKPQWPGAVMDLPPTWQIAETRFAERGNGTKRDPLLWQVPREDEKPFYREAPGHRMFQSWPETGGDWERRFKTVREWAMARAGEVAAPKEAAPRSAWSSGSFYLFAFVVIVVVLAALSISLAAFNLSSELSTIFVASILALLLVGALVLRHYNRISEKGFIEIIRLVLARVPWIGRPAGEKDKQP